MKTRHRILDQDARHMGALSDDSVDLIVTSPPYPMIEMWDEVFASLAPEIRELLRAEDGPAAFERMHLELDRVWSDCSRVLKPGGFACINIGDATRTIGGEFRLYSNHSRILQSATRAGLTVLPDILWRKPNNSPNKFLGSGVLPAGAYVTYEHEYVLVLRKGGKRSFPTADDRLHRMRSAFFWEERNVWFSDIWTDLRGTSQSLCDPETRNRSAAFPFELPWRLVQMYSVYGDTVLDPFLGTGTTSLAAAASARNSVGLDIDGAFRSAAADSLQSAVALGGERTRARLEAHCRFVDDRRNSGKLLKHTSKQYGFPVITRQEEEMVLMVPTEIREMEPGVLEACHAAAAVDDVKSSSPVEDETVSGSRSPTAPHPGEPLFGIFDPPGHAGGS